jgi:hypothetical protein
MFCKDDSLTYLNHLGYNIVRLPRENIIPLLVIAGEKDGLEALGPLSDFVLNGQPFSEVIYNEKIPDIASKKTNKLDLALGLDAMNRLLSAMGAVSGGLNLNYQKAVQIQILFNDVLSDYVYPTTIENYLSSNRPKNDSLLKEWVDKKDEAYIITRTIKSKSFGVVAYDKSGYPIEIDINGIQNLLGGSGKINCSKEGENTIKYQGKKYLVFGFQAISFSIKEDKESAKFKLTRSNKPTAMKGKTGDVPEQGNFLFDRNQLLDIHF